MKLFYKYDMKLLLAIMLLVFIFPECNETNDNSKNTKISLNTTLQDTILNEKEIKIVLKQRDEILKDFNEKLSPQKDSNYYHLIYYNAFNEGKTVKFEKKNGSFYMTVKNLIPDSTVKMSVYSTKISEYEWIQVVYMVENFDFWTEEQFMFNKVLDGHTFYLEVNKISKNGNMNRIVGRGSPRYDKIGALCKYILDHQESLIFQYKQINK